MTDLLQHGEPVPRYAMGVRNVLASPLTEWDLMMHGMIWGTDGVVPRPFAGLAPRIEALDEADAVTAEALNTVMGWRWTNA